MNAWLKEQWTQLCSPYDTRVSDEVFEQLIEAYNARGRFYHTSGHLIQLLQLSRDYSSNLVDKAAVNFAIFFHDFVYNVMRSDNEEKSAAVAEETLKRLGVPKERIEETVMHILATKTHVPNSENTDQLFFLDFDMSILGADEEVYKDYIKKLRKEFSIFPEAMFRKGRTQFIENTLAKPNIFLTPPLRERLEDNSRRNLRKELELLSGKS